MNAEYPGAILVPAHPTNYRNSPCIPRGWVLHSPEEPADNWPSTPYYFQNPNLDASTHYFVAYTGDVYQMVPETLMPIANGVKGKPYPAWADPSISLNRQTLSVEIEGYGETLQETMVAGGPQWKALVDLIANRAHFWRIPLDREHIIGHYQVADNRSDPGKFFPWGKLMEALEEGMSPDVLAAFTEVLRQLGKLGKDLEDLKARVGKLEK